MVPSSIYWSLLTVLLALTGCSTQQHGLQKNNAGIQMRGESLVLASTISGKLCFDALTKGSIVVRSTYLANDPACQVYEEGRDYTIHYGRGEISRTSNSKIPDYTQHPLYGQKDFDHTKFPDYSNHPYFVWVDYATKNGKHLAMPSSQEKHLTNFRTRLESGMPTTIVSYGNSITAGGEASTQELRFQYRYASYLTSVFPQANIKVEDVSIPGYTSSHGIELWDDYIGKTSPDLVLVGWGMNDHNIRGNSPEEFKNNLVQLVAMIKNRKNAEVILFSTFPPNDDWHFGSHRMERYAEATKLAALEAKCAYADVFATWQSVLERKDQPSLLGNNINHPNDFGHWLYAQAFKAISF